MRTAWRSGFMARWAAAAGTPSAPATRIGRPQAAGAARSRRTARLGDASLSGRAPRRSPRIDQEPAVL